jgi:hypothetical protein
MRLLSSCPHLLFALTVPQLSYAHSLVTAIRAQSVFEIFPAGTPGTCAGLEVDAMVSDAASLAQAAVNALDLLLITSMTGRRQVLVRTAKALWGATLHIPFAGVPPKLDRRSTAMLTRVRGNVLKSLRP